MSRKSDHERQRQLTRDAYDMIRLGPKTSLELSYLLREPSSTTWSRLYLLRKRDRIRREKDRFGNWVYHENTTQIGR